MKNMLITGGAGFVGSNFVKRVLQESNYNVINIDALTYAGNLFNLKEVEGNPHYTFIKESITNRKAIAEIMIKYDIEIIVNFAAESHVDRSISNPGIFVDTNVVGTQVLLDACKLYWQIGKDKSGYPLYREGVKHIQVSTDEVYGALGKTGMFTEGTPLSPNSPYSASKASADLLVRAYNETFKLPINITRCSNNYGPYQFPEKLIPLMINNCLNNKKLPVYGDGMQIRDWLHVQDHCDAILTVLEKGSVGEIYNIGGNNEKANIEIVKLIISALNKSEDLIAYVEDRLGHDRRYAIDNHKITSKLGWAPAYTFEEGIRETIEWYLKNDEWMSQVINNEYLAYYDKMYKEQ